jgi:ATP phosphoribosyltransferase
MNYINDEKTFLNTGLVYLSISGCNKITDQSLQEAFRFRELRYLDLNACSLVKRNVNFLVSCHLEARS